MLNETENKDSRIYRLYGFINMIDFFPDFVVPVFSCDEDTILYLQTEADSNLNNKGFVPVKTDYVKYTKKIEEMKNIILYFQKSYKVGDKYLVGFQAAKERIFISPVSEALKYVLDFKDNNDICEELKEEIIDFKDEVEQRKNGTFFSYKMKEE